MANIENQKIEVHETPEAKVSEPEMDVNERVDATGQDITEDVWDGEIDDLRNEPPYEPAGKEVTISAAHENVSRTEFASAPDVKEDFNRAAELPEASDNQTEKIDTSDHNLNPPEPPTPNI